MRQAGIAYAVDQIIDLYANGITNIHVYSMNKPEVAAGILDQPLTHAEVQETADRVADRFERLVSALIVKLGNMD